MATAIPRPKPGILDINAYVPGESNIPGGITPIKLSSNETPLGASPHAKAAYKAVADELERYPDGGSPPPSAQCPSPSSTGSIPSGSCGRRIRRDL